MILSSAGIRFFSLNRIDRLQSFAQLSDFGFRHLDFTLDPAFVERMQEILSNSMEANQTILDCMDRDKLLTIFIFPERLQKTSLSAFVTIAESSDLAYNSIVRDNRIA